MQTGELLSLSEQQLVDCDHEVLLFYIFTINYLDYLAKRMNNLLIFAILKSIKLFLIELNKT